MTAAESDIEQHGQILTDYLSVYPEEALKVPKLLVQDQDGKKLAKIIHVLEKNGTPQAQEALIEILNDTSAPKNNRYSAAIALGGIKNPTGETINALWDVFERREDSVSETVSNIAILSIGRISSAVKTKNPNLAKKINSQLSQSLYRKVNDKNVLLVILGVIGNTGNPFLVKKIIPFTNAESEEVRKSTVSAFRRMNDGRSLSILVKKLSRDKSAYVRKAIVDTLLDRKPNIKSVSVVQRLFPREKDKNVRKYMMRYLDKHKEMFHERDIKGKINSR